MPGRLDVVIFQNEREFRKFRVRTGTESKLAEKSAGVGSSRRFATYYQSPKAPIVTHELTHSVFKRAVGEYGGSWLQEGAAEYVETLWKKERAAKTFAARLRMKRYVPLREFVLLPELLAAEDVRGGARDSTELYEQAAAFYEFLMHGPLSAEPLKTITALASIDEEGDRLLSGIESVFGKPVAEVEAAWVKWGSRPPKSP